MVGRDKLEWKIDQGGQPFLPFAASANGRKVWPLLPGKGANFTEKIPGNYKKVWPSFEGTKMPGAREVTWIEGR